MGTRRLLLEGLSFTYWVVRRLFELLIGIADASDPRAQHRLQTPDRVFEPRAITNTGLPAESSFFTPRAQPLVRVRPPPLERLRVSADAYGAGWQPQRALRSPLMPNGSLLYVHADLLRHEGRPQCSCFRRASSTWCASAGARDARPSCFSAASRASRSQRREPPRLDRGR